MAEVQGNLPGVLVGNPDLNEKSTALAKTTPRGPDPLTISITDIGAGGKSETYSIGLTDATDWKQWGLLARSAILKKTTFKQQSLPEIMYAILYADNLGLDIVAGDVYVVDGRLNTTNGAKIKYAMSSGRIEGYDVQLVEDANNLIKLRKKVAGKDVEFEVPEITATATVHVKGWKVPFVYTAKLSEWYKGSNPNWAERPSHMLRLNTAAHALNMVVPMGTAESDEAPVAVAPLPTYEEAKAAAGK